MSCGLKKLKWRSALTVSCKVVGTTTADFITIIRVFLRGKSMLPCPKTCSGGAQFLLEFQTVVLYMHETSERSACTARLLCEYCFWASISSSFLYALSTYVSFVRCSPGTKPTNMVKPEVALVQMWTSASTQTILVLLGTSFSVTLNEERLTKQLD